MTQCAYMQHESRIYRKMLISSCVTCVGGLAKIYESLPTSEAPPAYIQFIALMVLVDCAMMMMSQTSGVFSFFLNSLGKGKQRIENGL